MFELIRKNRFFIAPYLLLLGIATFFLIVYSKSQIHIYLNQFHNPITDLFFKYLTYVGDGVVVAVFLIVLLFISYRYFLIMAGNVFLTTVVVQGFKRIIFSDSVRPSNFFSGIYELHLISGVDMHSFKSFPSGHTASAFGIFFMVALITKNNGLKFLFLITAFLTAYSRVYLSQHFLVDIFFGSLISTVFTFLMFYFGMKWQNKGLDRSLGQFVGSKG